MRDGAVRALLALAVVVAASCSISYVYLSDGGEASATRGDLTVTGGLARSGVDIDEYAGVGTLTYTSGGSQVEWRVLDLDGTFLVADGDGTYSERGYSAAAEGRTLVLDGPGTYGIRIYVDGNLAREGTAVLDGTVTREFSWSQTVSGVAYSYSVSYRYLYSDYASLRDDPDAVRHSSASLSPARFAEADAGIGLLESALSAEYRDVRGAAASGQAYADYLLSFVQCCISYPDTVSRSSDGTYVYDPEGSGDLFLKGTAEYWAYPLETIASGCGDCEDTSFLAAALFAAAGYESGVALLTDHMVAYVGLGDFTPRSVPSSVQLSSKTLDATGTNIFFCETTTDSFLYAGYVPVSTAVEIMGIGTVYPVGGSR